jgi:hypothetical protein
MSCSFKLKDEQPKAAPVKNDDMPFEDIPF